jgi:hypothetical protein
MGVSYNESRFIIRRTHGAVNRVAPPPDGACAFGRACGRLEAFQMDCFPAVLIGTGSYVVDAERPPAAAAR